MSWRAVFSSKSAENSVVILFSRWNAEPKSILRMSAGVINVFVDRAANGLSSECVLAWQLIAGAKPNAILTASTNGEV